MVYVFSNVTGAGTLGLVIRISNYSLTVSRLYARIKRETETI